MIDKYCLEAFHKTDQGKKMRENYLHPSSDLGFVLLPKKPKSQEQKEMAK